MNLGCETQHAAAKFSIPCYVIDAFADPRTPGTGNPAAVVMFDEETWTRKFGIENNYRLIIDTNQKNEAVELPEIVKSWMQSVAAEFNLSETAFLWPYVGHSNGTSTPHASRIDRNERNSSDPGILRYNIRYFTPTNEVSLCGHATLASASVTYQTTVLLQECDASPPKIFFHTSVPDVVLETMLSSYDTDQRRFTDITMIFPCHPPQELEDQHDRECVERMLFSSLNVDSLSILYIGLSPGLGDLFIELSYESFMQISNTTIDFNAFRDWDGYDRGVIVSCLEKKKKNEQDFAMTPAPTTDNSTKIESIDFYSRFFGPKCGINEDPVTGSAHCALAPYYVSRSRNTKGGTVTGYQNSPRGGLVRCSVSNDGVSVALEGSAVNTVSGSLWR